VHDALVRPRSRLLPALLVALAALHAPAARARGPAPRAGIGAVAEAALPPEARETISRIRQGGPFPGRRDGVVFENRERRLPPRARGYYREYTVPTPGARDRGARRIVAGGAGELYYSGDHYRSFRRVEARP
jgi:guanyl-specific ribonuclease Sa